MKDVGYIGIHFLETVKELKHLKQELEHLRDNPLDLNACQGWASVIGDFDEHAGIKPVREIMFSDLISQFQSDQQTLEEDNWPAHTGERWAQISSESASHAAEAEAEAKAEFWRKRTEEQERRELCAERWKKIAIPSHIPTPEELINMPLGMLAKNCAPLLIDTRATDSVIIEAFKIWLKEHRTKNTSGKSKRNKPDYKSWTEYGILPYLDLHIWSFENNIEISDEVIAEAITPNRSVEDFYKTTKSHAKALLHDLTELRAISPSSTTDCPTITGKV